MTSTMVWFSSERNRIITLVLLGTMCTIFEIFIHLLMGVSVAYTHVFYVLLALAAFWYGRVSIVLAASLSIVHIYTTYLLVEPLMPAVIRAIMLVAVTTLVALLSEERERYQQELLASKEKVEKKHAALVAYITECTHRLKNPVGIIHNNLATIRSRVASDDIDKDETLISLDVQIRNAEQTLENLRALNQAIVTGDEEIPEAYCKFLRQ